MRATYWQTVDPYRTAGGGLFACLVITTFFVWLETVGGTPAGGGGCGVPFMRLSSALKLLPPRVGSGSATIWMAAMRLSRKMR